ncbi:MAG: hypothetical protein ABFS45_16495, partial [Pseudomonadota bacterium]
TNPPGADLLTPSLGFALKGPAKLFKIVPDDFVGSLWLLNEGQPGRVGIKGSKNRTQTGFPSLRSPKSNKLLGAGECG